MTGSDGHFSSPGPSIPFIISTAVEQIRSTMSANGAILAVRERSGLRWIAGSGKVSEAGALRQLESAFTRQCLNTSRVVLCRDAQQDPILDPRAVQLLNLRSAICVPIHFREVLIGVIQLFSSVPDAFNGTHIEALQEIGELIAPVLATEIAADVVETSGPAVSEVKPLPNDPSHGQDSPTLSFADSVQPADPVLPPVPRQSRFFLPPPESATQTSMREQPVDEVPISSGATEDPSPTSEAHVPDPDFPVAAAAISSRFAKARVPASATGLESSVAPATEVPVTPKSPAKSFKPPTRSALRLPAGVDRVWSAGKAWLAAPMPPGILRDARKFLLETTAGRTSLLAICAAILTAGVYLMARPAKGASQLNPTSFGPSSRVLPAKQPVHRSPVIEPTRIESDSDSDPERTQPPPNHKGHEAPEASPQEPKDKVAPSMPPISAPNALTSNGTYLRDISAKPNASPSLSGVPSMLPLPSETDNSGPSTDAVGATNSRPDAVSSAASPTFSGAAPMTRTVDHSPPDFVLDRTLHGHSNWVTGVAFTAKGTRLASGSWDQTIKMWDVSTGLPVGTVSDTPHYIQALTSSPDGRFLAAENSRDSVTVWDTTTNTVVHTFSTDRQATNGNSWVYSIAFSPDDRLVAAGFDDKTVRIWDVQSGQAVRDLTAGHRSVIYVAFSPDGRYIVTGGTEKTIIIWNVATGEPLRKLSGHKKIVYTVAFSPDGRYLASASADKTLKIWDLPEGREIHSLVGHNGLVTTLAFSPDGRWLASGSWDKTIRIWDLQTGAPLQTLTSNTRSIYSIAFDPRGRWIASGSEDGTIRLWRQRSTSALRD